VAVAYGCRLPLLRQERKHHILAGAPASSLRVGRHKHVQLGSAALAWLYRALCDECLRIRLNTNLGGCAYLLHIWMWEHISIARSYRHAPQVCSSYLFSLYIFFVDCVLLTLWNIIFSHGHLRMSNPNPYWVTAGQGSRTSQTP
jgi:hypothetical protein